MFASSSPRPAFLSLGIGAILGTSCLATPVPPGATVPLSGSTGETYPDWRASIVQDDNLAWEVRNAADVVIMSGQLQNRAAISFSTGEILIEPRLRDLVAPTGTARIVRYEIGGYAGFGVDAEYALDGSGTIGPGQVIRSGGEGDTLEFDFSVAPVAPPDESRFMILGVDTVAYQPQGTATIYVEESPGGTVHSTVVSGVVIPIAADPSALKVLSIGKFATGQVSLHWIGVPNRWHHLEYSPDCTTWTKFSERYCDGTETTSNFFPPVPADAQFYRVRLPP